MMTEVTHQAALGSTFPRQSYAGQTDLMMLCPALFPGYF